MSGQNTLLYFVAFLAVVAGAFFAYQQGFADPLIEKIGVLIFKAKAKAEEKELEAEGESAGKDFFKSQLTGSKQASDVKDGAGLIGGLKKNA